MSNFSDLDKKTFPVLAGKCEDMTIRMGDEEINKMAAIGLKLALSNYLQSECSTPFETPSEDACISAAANYMLSQAIDAEKAKELANLNNFADIPAPTPSPFDLEQRIMDCWHVVDDINTLYEAIMDKDLSRDAVANILLGIRTLYPIRFEALFEEYEKQCCAKPHR